MLRHTGMCRQNGLPFHQESLHVDSTLVKKIHRGGSHFTKFAKKKMLKSAVFEAEKPLKMGLDLRKFRLSKPEKSLDMGRGFRPRAAHSVIK